tara:strand:- start:331 stop:1044 length:714 start_codon:yes stop_codon:yes gene_type:complete
MFVANWKMNGSSQKVENWLSSISSSQNLNKCIFCPPNLFLEEAKNIIKKNNLDISLGAQNVDPDTEISLTGGISPSMLKEIGCNYVIIGHSERREFYKESSDLLLDKAFSCLEKNLKVIFCIGESQEDRDLSKTKEKLSEQLRLLSDLNLEDFLIAYEPVWAIGSGKIPLLEEIADIGSFLSKELISLGQKQDEITILYGGSVNTSNAKEILQLESISGLLVGGASLDEKQFLEIIG